MLDQNTDRMWYVIGAVLIGAAIIFGMNTLMPEAFASIKQSFTQVVDNTEQRVNTIGVSKELKQVFTLEDMSAWRDGQSTTKVSENGAIISPDNTYRGGFYFSPDVFNKGTTYALEFDIQKISGDVFGLGGHLTVANEVDVRIDGQRMPFWGKYPINDTTVIDMTNEWNYPRVYPNDNKKHHVEIVFTVGDILWEFNDKIYIQPNRLGEVWTYEEHAIDYEVLIENVMLYEFVEEGDDS